MGNPSDGFRGKTISFTISNFYAEVVLWESEKLCFLPHPQHDGTVFEHLDHLVDWIQKETYHGGIMLLQATAKKFMSYCLSKQLISKEALQKKFYYKI